jgi:phenylacetate-CoA ligase
MWQSLTDASGIAAHVLRLLLSERWNAGRIAEFQRRRLVAQLRYAVEQIPYYRALGIDAAEINDVEDLSRFPKITKAIVQAESERLRNPELRRGRLFQSVTSGSSGEPTTTWFDADAWRLCKYALKIRRTLAAGFPLGQRLLIFDETRKADGGFPSARSVNFVVYRETRMSVFTPFEEQYVALVQSRPTAIYGSPSGVKELCDYADRFGYALPQVSTIFLASELISAEVRRRLESALSGRVVGIYGSTEFKEVAHECEHRRYHVNFESVYVETESEPGQEYPRLLITSLVNRAMPLIRFDIGDYARLGTDSCACGRSSPYLVDIAGREAEFLGLADGRRISPYLLTTAVEATPGLLKYQFCQNADRDLELRVVLSEAAGPTDAALRRIRESLRLTLGDGIEVAINRVDSISRTTAGKHRVVAQARS